MGCFEDTIDPNLKYEIVVDGQIIDRTTNLSYLLPVLRKGTYTITVQTKYQVNNRAVSKSIALVYTPSTCALMINFTTNDNYIDANRTQKAVNTITAINFVSGSPKVIY